MAVVDLLRRFPLTSYFVGAYAWTWLCWWTVAAAAARRLSLPVAPDRLATLGQFGPFAMALVVVWSTEGRHGLRGLLVRLVRWRARPVWLIVSLLLLPATMFGAIALYLRFHGATSPVLFRDTWDTLPVHFIYTLLLGGPLGEELGGRGFAFPASSPNMAQWPRVFASGYYGRVGICHFGSSTRRRVRSRCALRGQSS